MLDPTCTSPQRNRNACESPHLNPSPHNGNLLIVKFSYHAATHCLKNPPGFPSSAPKSPNSVAWQSRLFSWCLPSSRCHNAGSAEDELSSLWMSWKFVLCCTVSSFSICLYLPGTRDDTQALFPRRSSVSNRWEQNRPGFQIRGL